MASHVSKVWSLYKRILLLHRFMPIDLRALGDQYVKDEFRRHKTASHEEVKRFMTEWEVRLKNAVLGLCDLKGTGNNNGILMSLNVYN